jgi:hypothetical protein
MVVYTCSYTDEEVVAEFKTEDGFPERFYKHISRRWPINAHYQYMLSTNRTDRDSLGQSNRKGLRRCNFRYVLKLNLSRRRQEGGFGAWIIHDASG